MRNAKRSAAIGIIVSIAGIWITATFVSGQTRSLVELYKTGKIRFVPEITIADAAMGGKDFFSRLSDLAVDGRGFVYVCDSQAGNLKVFDPEGKYVKTLGRPGQGPGEFNYPTEVEIQKGRLFVRELRNGRVSLLEMDGTYISSIPIVEVGTIWWRMAVLPDGRVIAEREKTHIQEPKLPQEWRLELFSADLQFRKLIYAKNIWRNKYISEPRRTNVPVPFAPLVYWDVRSDGKIVIGDSGAYSIEIHDLEKGKLSEFTHAYKPVPVTASDKDAYFKGMGMTFGSSSGVTTTSRGAADYIVKLTEFPKFKPAFINLTVNPDNDIWVRPNLADESAGSAFDAFGPSGEFFGRVKLAGEAVFPYRIIWIKGGFWTIMVDKEGEYSIVKCRIEAEK